MDPDPANKHSISFANFFLPSKHFSLSFHFNYTEPWFTIDWEDFMISHWLTQKCVLRDLEILQLGPGS